MPMWSEEGREKWGNKMANRITTKAWVNASHTAKKIVESHVNTTVSKLLSNPHGNKEIQEALYDLVFNTLTDLEDTERIHTTHPHELAEILKDHILNTQVDFSNWESVMEDKIQLERLKHLNEIIKKKISQKSVLLPDEIRALEDNFTSSDVPEEVRYNTYINFIEDRLWELAKELKINMYGELSKDHELRKDHISEQYRLMADQRVIKMDSEEAVWELINKVWRFVPNDVE